MTTPRPFAAILLMYITAGCPGHQPHLRLPPFTEPSPPQTTRDSVVALALERALARGLPDYRARDTVVIANQPVAVSANALPNLASVHFVILDTTAIQTLVDETKSPINHLSVGRLELFGDSARVSVGSRYRIPRIRGPGAMSVSACQWVFRRKDGIWTEDHLIGCLIS
jgi:hypothetical protein